MKRVSTWLIGLVALLQSFACSPESFLGHFIDTPFAIPGVQVSTLTEDSLSDVMDAVNMRFRLYLELRDALPFEGLSAAGCLADIQNLSGSLRFDVDVACAFGQGSGTLTVFEEDLSSEEATVTRITITYRSVVVGALQVDGTEVVVETSGDDGVSMRDLDIVQNGTALAYHFRLGLIEDGQVIIDYQFDLPQGTLIARVSNPTKLGAFVTVTLTGTDGALVCEIRNTPWTLGAGAKGVCENGATFGLPAAIAP